MSTITIVFSSVFFLVIGIVYCLGWNWVKKSMPEHIVHYYLLASVIRFLLVATVMLGYIRLSGASRSDCVSFCIMFLLMYVVMMIVTISLKHK